MDYAEFESAAVNVKEQEIAVFRAMAALANAAVENGAAGMLAHLWACSRWRVNTLARVFEAFSSAEIHPDVPLGLYRAALDTDDPRVWLRRALAEGWSSRQLRDAADVAKGRRVSRVPLLANHTADVRAWEGGTVDGHACARVELDVWDLEPSGEPPRRVRIRAWELLEKGEK